MKGKKPENCIGKGTRVLSEEFGKRISDNVMRKYGSVVVRKAGNLWIDSSMNYFSKTKH